MDQPTDSSQSQPTASPQDQFGPLVTALHTFLEGHPDAETRIREILDKRLNPLDAQTWEAIFQSVQNYAGPNVADLLAYVSQSDQSNRLQEVGQVASPEVDNFLRTVVSLYGTELGNAYLTWNQLPNNWRMFYRDVYYDYINKRYHLRVRLGKYNGEEPFVEGDANSVLELTNFMIRTIRYVPVADAFSAALVDNFIEETKQFTEFVRPPAQTTPASQPDGQTKT